METTKVYASALKPGDVITHPALGTATVAEVETVRSLQRIPALSVEYRIHVVEGGQWSLYRGYRDEIEVVR
jgi:hypothetical protein